MNIIIPILGILFIPLLVIGLSLLAFRVTTKMMRIPWGKRANENSKAFRYKNGIKTILYIIAVGIGIEIVVKMIGNTLLEIPFLSDIITSIPLIIITFIIFREIKKSYALKTLPAVVFTGLFSLVLFVINILIFGIFTGIFGFFLKNIAEEYDFLSFFFVGSILLIPIIIAFASLFLWIFLVQPLIIMLGDKLLRTINLFKEEHNKKYFIKYPYALAYGFLGIIAFWIANIFPFPSGIFFLGAAIFSLLFLHYRKHNDAYVPAVIIAFVSMIFFGGIWWGGEKIIDSFLEKNTPEITKEKRKEIDNPPADTGMTTIVPKEKNGYSFSEKSVSFFGKEIPEANIETFEVIEAAEENSIFSYAKDASNVFFGEKKIENANPEIFEILKNGYAKDAENVFYETEKINSADAETFLVIGDSMYAEDEKYIYYKKIPLAEADKNSFFANGIWAKDKEGIFFEGQRETDEEKIKNAEEFLKEENMTATMLKEEKKIEAPIAPEDPMDIEDIVSPKVLPEESNRPEDLPEKEVEQVFERAPAPVGYYDATVGENEEKIDIENAWIQDKAREYLIHSEDALWTERTKKLSEVEGVQDAFCGRKGCIYVLENGKERIYENGKVNIPVFVDEKIAEDVMQIQSAFSDKEWSRPFPTQNEWKQKIGYGYYLEGGNIWYFGGKMTNTDVKSFETEEAENHAYAKDKNSVYCQGRATPLDIELFSWRYAQIHATDCPPFSAQ